LSSSYPLVLSSLNGHLFRSWLHCQAANSPWPGQKCRQYFLSRVGVTKRGLSSPVRNFAYGFIIPLICLITNITGSAQIIGRFQIQGWGGARQLGNQALSGCNPLPSCLAPTMPGQAPLCSALTVLVATLNGQI
jgi:hypothetical protein